VSLIKTWKCDACGAISRGEKPSDWYVVMVRRFAAPGHERLFFGTGPNVSRHACSVECVGRVLLEDEVLDEVNALEVAAE